MIKSIIYAMILTGMIIWFIIAGKNKSKWGINFKRVHCPVCQIRQPFIRIPNNLKQGLWGGTNCPKCHTNLDKYGDIIS